MVFRRQAAVRRAMTDRLSHRHGARVHSHVHAGTHRHLLLPQRSTSPHTEHEGAAHHHHDHGHGHGHTHGLVDASIKRSREGLRAVGLALLVLGVGAVGQLAVFAASGSVALLADMIHNFGDAATAIPLGIAFALRSARAERAAGLAVVLAIFVSACVAGYEAIDRLIDPREPRY